MPRWLASAKLASAATEVNPLVPVREIVDVDRHGRHHHSLRPGEGALSPSALPSGAPERLVLPDQVNSPRKLTAGRPTHVKLLPAPKLACCLHKTVVSQQEAAGQQVNCETGPVSCLADKLINQKKYYLRQGQQLPRVDCRERSLSRHSVSTCVHHAVPTLYRSPLHFFGLTDLLDCLLFGPCSIHCAFC